MKKLICGVPGVKQKGGHLLKFINFMSIFGGSEKKTVRREGILNLFSYVLFSVTHIYKEKNGSKLQSLLDIIFSKNYFVNGNHIDMSNIVII